MRILPFILLLSVFASQTAAAPTPAPVPLAALDDTQEDDTGDTKRGKKGKKGKEGKEGT